MEVHKKKKEIHFKKEDFLPIKKLFFKKEGYTYKKTPALVAVMISYLGLSMKKHLTENV